MKLPHLVVSALVLATASMPSVAQTPPMLNEAVARYDRVRPQADFTRRTVMIPMRDGTKLHTVIVFRKGVKDAPILLSRTPYDADAATSRNRSQKITEILPIADGPFVDDGPMLRPRKPASPLRYFNSSPEVIRPVLLMYVSFRCRSGMSKICCSSAASTSSTRRCGSGGIGPARCSPAVRR